MMADVGLAAHGCESGSCCDYYYMVCRTGVGSVGRALRQTRVVWWADSFRPQRLLCMWADTRVRTHVSTHAQVACGFAGVAWAAHARAGVRGVCVMRAVCACADAHVHAHIQIRAQVHVGLRRALARCLGSAHARAGVSGVFRMRAARARAHAHVYLHVCVRLAGVRSRAA